MNCPCNNVCLSQYYDCTGNKCKFSEITADFVFDQICNMQKNKSPGFSMSGF